MKAGLKKFFLLQRGSVLMEFVLVLPVYLAVLGGILWMGFRSLDAIGLRSADRWGAWMAGERFAPRVPALTALQSVFPRTYIIHTSVDRALVGPQSFLQFIGSRAEIGSTMPDYIDGLPICMGMNPPFSNCLRCLWDLPGTGINTPILLLCGP